MKPSKIPQNKTTHDIFKKGGPSITVKKGGPEAIASLASPNIHHWLQDKEICSSIHINLFITKYRVVKFQYIRLQSHTGLSEKYLYINHLIYCLYSLISLLGLSLSAPVDSDTRNNKKCGLQFSLVSNDVKDFFFLVEI